jgi:hypothetical protein
MLPKKFRNAKWISSTASGTVTIARSVAVVSPNSFPDSQPTLSSKMASMKINRFALVLTVVNVLAMLAFWSQQQVARAQAVPDMLRARGLEIVDDRGIVRAQIVVQPNDGGGAVSADRSAAEAAREARRGR